VPVAEAMVALVLADHLLRQRAARLWFLVKRRRSTPMQASGHARRRLMKTILNWADPFLSRSRMPFIPDASIGVFE